MNEKYAYLLGTFAGDGWFETRGIGLGTKDKIRAEFLSGLIKELFNKKPIVKLRKYKDGHELYIIRFFSKALEKRFREELGGVNQKKSKHFKVNLEIKNEVTLSRTFVKGLMDAEGYIYSWKGKPRFALEIYNIEAAEFIHKNFLRDGIKSSLSHRSNGGFRVETTGKNNIKILNFLYRLPGGKSQL